MPIYKNRISVSLSPFFSDGINGPFNGRKITGELVECTGRTLDNITL